MNARPSKPVKPPPGTPARKPGRAITKVPGPSSNSATNILIWDVATRGITMIVGRQIAKAMLRLRYHPQKASDIVEGRSMAESLAATGAARVASKSIPGLFVVSGALLAKAAFDRGFSRRKPAMRGEKQIAEQAAKADE